MSNVSKNLDFSQVSPQAVAITCHSQSADYLKKLSPVKQQIIAKGNQFMKLNKSQKYVEQVSKTLNELGLVMFKPWGENVSPEEVKLNTFFKIFFPKMVMNYKKRENLHMLNSNINSLNTSQTIEPILLR